MSLDLHTLLACVAIPAAISIVAVWIAWRLDCRNSAATAARTDVDKPATNGMAASSSVCGEAAYGGDDVMASPAGLSSLVLATGWWLAVTIGILGAETPAFWPDDGWPKVIWPMLASVIAIASWSNGRLRTSPGLWVVFGWIAVATGSLAMPVGDGWADMWPLHRNWMSMIAIAATANAFALFSMVQRAAGAWVPPVILAGLACPAISGAASYSALWEACLAAIVATTVLALWAATGRRSASYAILFPSALFMATMVSASRFRSYDEVPSWAYAVAFFAPTLIALADLLVAKSTPRVRVTVAALMGLLIVCSMAYQFLLA